ncbi:MAG: sensor histidine kinase [Campylobacterales bacterium]
MKTLFLSALLSLTLWAVPGQMTVHALPHDGVWLHGEWLFCPDRFLDPAQEAVDCQSVWVPREWGMQGLADRGFGTYRLELTLPEAGRYAIKIASAAAAYRLYADDRLVKSVGAAGTDAQTTEHAYHPYPVLFDANQRVRLTIHAANFAHRAGGLNVPVRLLPEAGVTRYELTLFGKDLFLLGAFGMMALYHFGLFVLRRRDKAALLFALFAASLSLRMATTGQKLLLSAWPEIPWTALLRLEYVSGYVTLPLFIAFIGVLYPANSHRLVIRAFGAVSTAFVLWALLMPPLWVTGSRIWFEWVLLAFVCYTLYILVRSALQRQQGAAVALTGFALFAATIFVDVLYFHSLIALKADLIPFGFFVFVLSWSFVLAQKYARAFETIDIQRQSLEEYKTQLEVKVEARTRALADSLREKELLLKEVFHRVKNNLQLIIGLIGLKMRRVDSSEAKETLREMEGRIKAIALVHERLYQGDRVGHLELGGYIRAIAAQLILLEEERRIELSVRGEPLYLELEQAVLVGLILNELLTNSLKYAFEKIGGSIGVEYREEDDRCILLYRDSGPGWPAGFDPQSAKTLGMRMITALSRQMGGTFRILPQQGGGAVELTFAKAGT